MLMGGMAMMLLFGLTACGGSDYDNSKNDVSPEPSPTEESSNADDEAESGDSTGGTKTDERSYKSGGEEINEKSYEVEIDGEGNGQFEGAFDGYGNEINQEDGK